MMCIDNNDGNNCVRWGESTIESDYQALMDLARQHLDLEFGQAIILKTATNNFYGVQIPDYRDSAVREPLENRCVEALAERDDTEVIFCLATVNATNPMIPSWNLLTRLVKQNEKNLLTKVFLWGGDENIFVKTIEALMPPPKSN